MAPKTKKSFDMPSEICEFEEIAILNDKSLEPQIRETHWFSLYIAAILAFLGCIQLGLYFSSVWPYLQEIDQTITEKFLGFVFAAYSFGDLLSSPIFGYWSKKIAKIKPLIYIGFLSMFFGNIIYISAGIMPFKQRYFILFARFFTGFGFSYVSLLRAYAVSVSIPSDRSKAIAYITGGIALGATTGPALQLIFTPLGRVGIRIIGDLHFNIYTGPAILACFINLAAYFLIYFCFTEKNIGVIDKNTAKEKGVDLPPYCRIAVAVCYLTCFCLMFVVINLETYVFKTL
uniref:Major facilitator superfamily (MFS) profile domain-containing protein n=1 Tax=Panagrolaimus superbus TaxID=310955 RepID=A0A914YGH0_9BILA